MSKKGEALKSDGPFRFFHVNYQGDIEEGHFVEGCLSRKKHVVPLVMQVLEN